MGVLISYTPRGCVTELPAVGRAEQTADGGYPPWVRRRIDALSDDGSRRRWRLRPRERRARARASCCTVGTGRGGSLPRTPIPGGRRRGRCGRPGVGRLRCTVRRRGKACEVACSGSSIWRCWCGRGCDHGGRHAALAARALPRVCARGTGTHATADHSRGTGACSSSCLVVEVALACLGLLDRAVGLGLLRCWALAACSSRLVLGSVEAAPLLGGHASVDAVAR